MKENVSDVVRDLVFPMLRYDLPDAMVDRLPKTGDADKYMVTLTGRSGAEVKKPVMIGSCVQSVSTRFELKSELAYQILKRTKEAARDLAEMEGIDWKKNEEEWKGRRMNYDIK